MPKLRRESVNKFFSSDPARNLNVLLLAVLMLIFIAGCPSERSSSSPTRSTSPPTISQAPSQHTVHHKKGRKGHKGYKITSQPSTSTAAVQHALSNIGDKCYPGEQIDVASGNSSNKTYQHQLAENPIMLFASLTVPKSPSHFYEAISTNAQDSKKTVIHDLGKLSYLSDIEMARFRKGSSELILLGPPATGSQGLSYLDWLTVFRAISELGAPGVSIDPGPDPSTMTVKYFGGVEHTNVGGLLFEADRTLKMMSTGFDNLDCSRWINRPVSIPTELELLMTELRTHSTVSQSGWHRFWFEPSDDKVEISADGLTIKLPIHRLVVKDESIPPGRPSTASEAEFAANISDQFLHLTGEIPSFAQLQKIAALVALAKWIKDKQIPVDQDWLQKKSVSLETPATTPSITVARATVEDEVYLRVGIHGGVDFQKENLYEQGTDSITPVQIALQNRPPGQSAWQFSYNGKTYQAISLKYRRPVQISARTAGWTRSIITVWRQPSPYRLVLPTGKVVVDNGTGAPLGIDVKGPESKHLVVNGSSLTVRLLLGSYYVTTTSKCGTKTQSLNLDINKDSSLTYTCAVAPVIAPPVMVGTLNVANNTGAAMTLQLSGAAYQTLTAPPGNWNFTVPAGYYSITANSRCGARTESANVSAGVSYQTVYQCEQQTQQSISTGANLVINNDTGASMTVHVSGTTQGIYTAPPGSSTIQLVPGVYSISVASRCGTRVDSVNLSDGSTVSESYTCTTY